MRRFSVLVVHRRGGKTVLAVIWLIHKAITFSPPVGAGSGRYAYVAPEKGQAKRVAWDYLKRYALRIPGTKANETELWVEFPNGSRIQIDGADEPDRLRGIYLDGVVLDELADMRPTTWGEVVRPALADRQGWAVFIGTPKGLNLLSELYYSANGKADWFAARYTIEDTQAIPAEEVESARRDMSEAQFRQEFLCDFSAGNDDAFISSEVLDEASKRQSPSLPSDPLVIGCDVARFGSDESVIWFRKGRDAFTLKPVYLRGADTMQVAARLCEEAAKYHAEAVFIDESGVGGGVVDRCRQLGIPNVMGVNNGGRSDSPIDGELVANKAAEMWCKMRQWVKSGGSIPRDDELIMQMGSRRYLFNAHNEIQLEKKADMKKRGLSSPDRADALALTFAYPIAPRPIEADHVLGMYVRAKVGGGNARGEYDPFARLR